MELAIVSSRKLKSGTEKENKITGLPNSSSQSSDSDEGRVPALVPPFSCQSELLRRGVQDEGGPRSDPGEGMSSVMGQAAAGCLSLSL